MAQLLLITEKSNTLKDNREPGDIVGVFDDAHVFSDHERDVFDIVKVPDTKETVTASQPAKSGVAHRLPTTDWTVDMPEEKPVWQDSQGNWREIKERPRFRTAYKDGKIVETYSRFAVNTETVLIPARLETR